jgi:hypothetical protein
MSGKKVAAATPTAYEPSKISSATTASQIVRGRAGPMSLAGSVR